MIAAPLAALFMFAGCAEPRLVGPAPEPSRTPEPTPSATPYYIPGTSMRPGPTPGTALGPNGAVLRYVPPVAGWEPECRPATRDERAALEWHVRNNTTLDGVDYAKGAPQAVSLPESGWSVIAYWERWGNGEAHVSAAVRGGGTISGVGTAWAGTHAHGGAAFADGPQAMRSARECLNA